MLLQAHLSWNQKGGDKKGLSLYSNAATARKNHSPSSRAKGARTASPFFPTALFQYLSLTMPQQKPGDKGNQVPTAIRG